ncbi:MAG: YceD family protein [Cyanobacteria bacterium P01_H01_bin.15]
MEVLHVPCLLKLKNRCRQFALDEWLPELQTLTPVRGELSVTHGGTFIEVKATIETIVTLACDRCLNQYNQRLVVDTSEIIWLDRTPTTLLPAEQEVPLEDLTESLPAEGFFSPSQWLYEQLCLATPLRKICDRNCQQPESQQPAHHVDGRWAALAKLKDQLS